MQRTSGAFLFAVFLLTAWEVGARPFFNRSTEAQTKPSTVADNEESARMFVEDQADRDPKRGKIDWAIVGPRDKKRLARAHELYRSGALRTGNDHYQAAMVLQHGDQALDFLLAHELCVVAIGKGEDKAKRLAAAAEDRFLMNIGRSQRFGTQYKTSGPKAPYRLYKVEEGVTDDLRRAFNTPTLERARERETEMNK